MKESNYSNCKKVDNDDSLEQFEIQESVPGFGHRHKQCLILFMCLTTAYSMRACMGVAVGHDGSTIDNFISNVDQFNFHRSMAGQANAYSSCEYINKWNCYGLDRMWTTTGPQAASGQL
ncbi:hypothetical protein EVAR_99532_1 [Eumeta japonica]|uniref:Uncharacterized protein n=1 Tax=Eumeta variegata TaxID=151549 RepID=A0A4C2A1H1_EUMVA|nr:hypothetical protein EVAR_99532_1 [Eumeta japonica]